MQTLYAAAYLVPPPLTIPDDPTPLVAAFHQARRESRFPFDVGDDPAFFAARQLDGPITWGVCRRDVRTRIAHGDWITFFAARQYPPCATEYYFVGALCVERKISHTRVWSDGEPLSRYLNLLIRPCHQGWEHFEPALAPKDWHKDWLWRVVASNGNRKEEVLRAGLEHKPGAPLPFEVADSYVAFSKESRVVPPHPVLVATHSGPHQGTETWLATRQTQAIREAVFAGAQRGLRTTNRQQPHRHFRRPLSDLSDFRRALSLAIQGAG